MKRLPARTLLLALAAVTSAAASGGCALSVEADAPDVELTRRDLTFQGIPAAAIAGNTDGSDVSITQTFTQDHSAIDLPDGVSSEVKALDVTLVAKSGVTDFGFIHALRLVMRDKDGAADPVELLTYEKAANATVGDTLVIPAKNPENIVSKWSKKGTAAFDIQLAGQLPTNDWSVDLHVHFSGSAKYKY